ncbi:DUF2017 domain-containing protein [Streptomyces spirodelae]|uniref:DUF2017 domain-containing protein n=1 Tax=Streptomyces spirodelae TaxID=2812904 RepID=A0ABS3WNY2_9ACTN|nr:DUF2017 domain-containing protein [Streptomyces spirodelae]MBO8184816.1 DUF2017 domain-containing protein [Streptomyces spirodelae]
MAGHFEPTEDGGATIALDEVEISILRSLAVQLLELIGPGSEPADQPRPPRDAESPAPGGARGGAEGGGESGGSGSESMEDELAGIEAVSWPPFADGPSEPPADPALARLFPDAYGPGPQAAPPEDLTPGSEEAARAKRDRAASAEFRRYTENDLRARKREDGLAVVRALDALTPGESGAVLTLTPAQSQQWLGALNDLRLAIGTRLEVSDDTDDELYQLPDSDERKPMVMAYLWLGGLQETLVETLMP